MSSSTIISLNFENYIRVYIFKTIKYLKEGLYRIWCGVNRLSDSGVHTLGDTSAFVNPAGQLLLNRRGKTRMVGVSIVFEFYIAPLKNIYLIPPQSSRLQCC